MSPTGTAIAHLDDADERTAMAAGAGFLAGYCGSARRAYATDLRLLSACWCADAERDLLDVRRAHLELFGRWMEETGRMRSTVARRLSTLASFYRYCHQEGLIDRRLSTLASFYRYCHQEGLIDTNPALNVRRPKLDCESRTLGLDRNELGAFLVQAGLGSARDHALASLLALNGLRISEDLGSDIDDLDFERGHRTLQILRKGGKHVTIPLAPRTSRAVDLYIGERISGPIFLGANGGRMDRYAADRMVKRLARRAGVAKRQPPLASPQRHRRARRWRPLRDVKEAASHADPRTTMRYDRGRGSLDRHATYVFATFLAGASR
jgi:site-specific recombinase XerD